MQPLLCWLVHPSSEPPTFLLASPPPLNLSDSESAFPSLGAAAPAPKGQWGKKLSVKATAPSSASAGNTNAAAPSTAGWSGTAPVIQRATFQEIFSLPVTDHTDAARFTSAMQRVLEKNKGKVRIEASTTRTGSTTTFVIRAGDQKKVNDAKRELQVLLAKNVSILPESMVSSGSKEDEESQ